MRIIKGKETSNNFISKGRSFIYVYYKITQRNLKMNRIPSVISTNNGSTNNNSKENHQEVLSVEGAAKKYFLITPADTAKNINSEFGIGPEVQLAMANGNTQFIIELAREFKYNVTIPTIALQIAARFFHTKCYINYDRFMVLVSCLMIAAKYKDMEVGLKKLCFCTYNVLSKRLGLSKIHNEGDLSKIREEVCIAECEVLRTL